MTSISQVQRVRKLYKTIMKLHRGLPEELKILGDGYARDEFKRHKTCLKSEAEVFMTEWTKYALELANQLGFKAENEKNFGSRLESDIIEVMRDEQINQLYELMLAAKGKREQKNLELKTGDIKHVSNLTPKP